MAQENQYAVSLENMFWVEAQNEQEAVQKAQEKFRNLLNDDRSDSLCDLTVQDMITEEEYMMDLDSES